MEPLAFIVWPKIIIIKSWVKPGPVATQPMQVETLTQGDLRMTPIPEPALFRFEMSVRCEVLSFPLESIAG